MSNDDLRQLVKIRHELRRLMPADSGAASRDTARDLLARMRALVAPHSTEQARIEPEVTRWRSVFQLPL